MKFVLKNESKKKNKNPKQIRKKKPIWIKNLKRHNKKMNQNKKQKN